MHLDQQIRELLYQYDCVIVPGLGGFVCSFNPARIHPVQHRFYPPSKRISFNQMLAMNDGLLGNFIAISEHKSYTEALQLIDDEVAVWKNALRQKGRINLEGIGGLFKDSAGNLQFQPDEQINYLRESYGLTEFQALPVDRSKSVQLPVEEQSEKYVKIRILPVVINSIRYSVAAAILSFTVLATIKLNLLPDLKMSHISMNPFRTEAPIYKPLYYDSMDNSSVDLNSIFRDDRNIPDTKYAPIDCPIEGTIFNIISESVDAIIPVEPATTGPYHVVGGCFSVLDNAEKLMSKLQQKGYSSSMPGRYKGLHVVAYQSFQTDHEARIFLQKVKADDNAQAWILRK